MLPRGPLHRMSRVPHEHSFRKARALRFLRVETRSTRLSLGARFSRFGTVSARSYWQALAGPFMVELFTAECFAPSPTPVRSASPLAELKAPHASRVERAPWPEPLGRDFHPLCAITASMVDHQGLSLSPRLGGRTPAIPSLQKRGNTHVSGLQDNVHRIEHRDWDPRLRGGLLR